MRLKRYLKLWLVLFRYNLQVLFEFRGEFLFWTINIFLWLAIGFLALELIFGQIETIAGWSKNEVYLVFFIASLFSDLFWTFFFGNLSIFSHLIRLGELDYLLLKPVNQRFLLSFQYFNFDHLLRMVFLSYLIYRYTILTSGRLVFLNFFLFLFLFFCGVIIFYSLFFALTLLNIWFVNLSSLLDFFQEIRELGAKPIYIFKKFWFYLFSLIVPVGYIATFPAQALMGRIEGWQVIAAPILAVVFFILSDKFFHFALKHYSSASS
jgi:ABC-2 type transport system permease protein